MPVSLTPPTPPTPTCHHPSFDDPPPPPLPLDSLLLPCPVHVHSTLPPTHKKFRRGWCREKRAEHSTS